MTATFNSLLLDMLQKMTGVKISSPNCVWSSRVNMARRNICIHVDFTTQRLRHINSMLENTISNNLNKKCIVYTNTSLYLEQIHVDVELWLVKREGIQGDMIVIYGDLKSKVL